MNALVRRPFRTVNTFPTPFDNLFSNVDFFADNRIKSTIPAVNVLETDDDIKIELAVPGLKKENLKIDLDVNTLTISTEQKSTEEEETKNYNRKEFSYASFSRSFKLPKLIDADNIEATYEDGILLLTLPKKEEAKSKEPRQISVG